MTRKILSLILAIMMIVSVFSFVSCGDETKTNGANEEVKKEDFSPKSFADNDDGSMIESIGADEATIAEKAKDFKIGFITLHDDSSTYDKNFIDAMYRALDNLGIDKSQLVMHTGIPETEECYNMAKDCVNQGCGLVFADSFGHEDFLIQAAMEYPDVRFAHATGTKAHTANLPNFSDAFASIYEGRYAAGIVAGMKLNEMMEKDSSIKPVMGYVGAFTYAEVMSGYTSFFLGAKSVCPDVTMKVKFTGSWYDYDKEKAAAEALISDGCVLISQHADSYGAPEACEAAGVPNVSYNGSTESVGPNTYLVSSKIDWTPYFEYIITCAMMDKDIVSDYVGTVSSGSVVVLETSDNVAEGTQEAVDAAMEAFKAGTLHVFDVNNFTVTVDEQTNTSAKVDENGHLTSYLADVDTDEAFAKDTEVIADGYFHESEYRSAPYFDCEIDGITLLDRSY